MNREGREGVGREGKGEGGTMQAPRSSRFALVWVDLSGGPFDLWSTRPFALNPPLQLWRVSLLCSLYAFSSLLSGKYMFCWRYVLVILIERELHLHTFM